MLDPVSLSTTAVAVLSPLLAKAADKAAESVGENVINSVFGGLKKLLGGKPKAEEALAELAAQPADVDAQGALRLQLRKAIEADQAFAEELKGWLGAAEKQFETIGHTQTATISGDNSRVNQTVGSGNQIG